jgi:hypothetical protein
VARVARSLAPLDDGGHLGRTLVAVPALGEHRRRQPPTLEDVEELRSSLVEVVDGEARHGSSKHA